MIAVDNTHQHCEVLCKLLSLKSILFKLAVVLCVRELSQNKLITVSVIVTLRWGSLGGVMLTILIKANSSRWCK